jgi:hypothetical protein
MSGAEEENVLSNVLFSEWGREGGVVSIRIFLTRFSRRYNYNDTGAILD